MTRRHHAVIVLVIAVGLFVAPLISPVPNYDSRLGVSVDDPHNVSTESEKENGLENLTTMRYQQLSTPAQRLFDRGSKKGNEVTVPHDEAPESFATLVPESGYAETIYIRKAGQYYYVEISQTTRRPSFQAFLLRLGSLLGAIGLGTLAGYFVLTAED